MKLSVIAILAISLLVFAGVYNPMPANAQTSSVNYTFSYDFANRYNTQQIEYSFSNLVATDTYTWAVYTVSIQTGGLLSQFGSTTSTPDNRSGSPTDETFRFGGVDFSTALGTIVYPPGYSGPIAVVDTANGTILGRHFIVERPTFVTTPDSQWLDGGAGNTTFGERQVIGPTRFSGDCRNPVYNEFNSDGWLHSFNPCSVTTVSNGFAILHYQMTAAYDPASDDDDIVFYRVPDTDVEFRLPINDLIDFQQTAAYTPGVIQDNFIVVNTSGRLLPFLDNTRCAQAFSNAENPCISGFNPGVFNYSRYTDAPAWVSDGESVWIVTSDPTLREWGIKVQNDEVREAGRQIVTITSVTEAVWTSYHGTQVLEDSQQGTIDSTVYAFSETRSYPYTAASVPGGVIVEWTVAPSSINSGLATASEMAFAISDFYAIVEVVYPPLDETLNEVLQNTGLDTDSGRAAVLTILLFVGMIGVAAFSALRGNIYAYLVVWTGLGSVFILGDFGTMLVNTMFIIMTITMWVFAILVLKSGTSSNDDV